MRNKKLKNKSGITLVALVVTIIILLILAGVSIAQLTGNGLFVNAQKAANEQNKQTATEKMNLKITNIQINGYAEKREMPTLQDLADKLCEDIEMQYVTLESKVVSTLEKITVGDASSIYTKLKDYPFEFEINSSLQLASIDGVKVSSNTNNNYDIVEVGNVKVDIIDKYSGKFTIKVIPESPEKIAMYQYYVNEELLYEGIKTEYVVNRLRPSTKYRVQVKVVPKTVVDVQGIDVTTLDAPMIEFANKYDKYIVIDSNNGDDTSGNGSKNAPYKTLDKIADSGIIENGYSYGIILNDGTYSLTTKIFTLACNKSINIIGNRNNTVLNVNGIYSNSSGGSTNYSLNFYRLIWYAETLPTNAIYAKTPMNFYNILIDAKSTSGNTSYFIPGSSYNFYNCTLSKRITSLLRTTQGTIKLINCYGGFTSGYGTSDGAWNYQTNRILSTYTLESDYRITEEESVWKDVGTGDDLDGSQADLGVYGGAYSWEWEADI